MDRETERDEKAKDGELLNPSEGLTASLDTAPKPGRSASKRQEETK